MSRHCTLLMSDDRINFLFIFLFLTQFYPNCGSFQILSTWRAPEEFCYVAGTVIFCPAVWLGTVTTAAMEIVVFNPHRVWPVLNVSAAAAERTVSGQPAFTRLTKEIYYTKITLMSAPREEMNSICVSLPTAASESACSETDKVMDRLWAFVNVDMVKRLKKHIYSSMFMSTVCADNALIM